MRASKPLTITLPQKMADEVKARVASGDYASESEVIREGLRALAAQEAAYDRAFEHWVQTEGKKRIADYEAGRSKFLTSEEAGAELKAYFEKREAEEAEKAHKAPAPKRKASRG